MLSIILNLLFFRKVLKLSGFPIPEKTIYCFFKLNLLKFVITYFVLKILILGLIIFINLIILLFFFDIFFKKTTSYFFKLFNFSLKGPAGINCPFPIQLNVSKQTIFKS